MQFDLNKIDISYHDKKIDFKPPKHTNNKLAEFIGIMTGDGYMNTYPKYRAFLEIAGDSRLDYDYLTNYVKPMIKELFNLNAVIVFRKKQNTMYLRLTTKGIVSYLEHIGFMKGKKKNIGVPRWIQENDEYMLHFIRGLIDTDGCLALLNRKQARYRYYPKICLASSSYLLIYSVGNWLKGKGYSVVLSRRYGKRIYKGEIKYHLINRIQINGRKAVKKWMEFINFRNKRHLDKHKKYLKSMKRNGTRGI